jgi:hypothetical protein
VSKEIKLKSSNNPLRNSTNNKIPFFPFIFQKDFFGFILILCLYLLQTHKDKRGDLSNHFLSLIFHLLPTVGALPGLGCHLVIHLAVTKDLTSSWKFCCYVDNPKNGSSYGQTSTGNEFKRNARLIMRTKTQSRLKQNTANVHRS